MPSIPLDSSAPSRDPACSECPAPDPENEDCKDCAGEDTGECDNSSSSFSGFPVRYSTGEIRLVSQDLSSRGFNLPWGHTRSYSNRVSEPDEGINGSSWFIKQVPHLGQDSSGNIAVVGVVNDAVWFDKSGSVYTGRFFIKEALTEDSAGQQFIFTDTRGQVTKFFNFDATIPLEKRGKFKSFSTVSGREIVAEYWSTNNLIKAFVQVSGAKSSGYHYDYYSSGANANRLQYATYRVDGNDVRRAKYDHHDGTDAYGSAGDLKRATIQRNDVTAGWVTLTTSYYRYYKAGDSDGFVHGLKYVLSPLGYANMIALGITPEIATDSQLASFARNFFRYDSEQRVIDESVNNGGLHFNFMRTTSAFADGFNNWKQKMVEVLPTGHKNIVYTNYAGQPMLKVFVKVVNGIETNDKWYQYWQYNSSGQITLKAESSAVSSYDEATAGLVTLRTSAGLIHVYEYYGASPPTGGAQGYLQYHKIRQGSSGASILVKEWHYIARVVGSTTVYFPWKDIIYQSDVGGGDPATTTYAYTWHEASFQMDQRTTTLPIVPVAQNGSGVANSQVEAFDAYGHVIWRKDERDYIVGFTYDLSTGGLIQRVNDASVGTPWTPLPGSHFNLTTDYTVDTLGRVTQELGAEHAIDLSGTSTNIRRAVWKVYLDDSYEEREGVGYRKADGTDTLINPVKINRYDNVMRLEDAIQATRASISGKLLPTDDFPQTSWVRWTKNDYRNSVGLASVRVYFLIPSSGEGAKDVNYTQTNYGYDIMRREIREESPGGTITRFVYHPRGWVVENWRGTNDNGATDVDPGGGGAVGNNMVKIEARQYDHNAAAGDGNLTQTTQYQDAAATRTALYEYDWRNRETAIDRELDFYQTTAYDNLDRPTRVDRRNTTSSGNLIDRMLTNYDNVGHVYQRIRYGVDPATGTVGNSLIDSFWFDPSGNLIKQNLSGGSILEKTVYDGVGRLSKQYASYNSAETAYPYPISVANDTVFQQVETTFDAATNRVQQIVRRRFHDATGTGDLTSPSGSQPRARVTYVAFWPDPLGRQTKVANYGTNGGVSLVRPATAPARSDTILVTTTDYNDKGEAHQITDPKSTVNQVVFDAAERVIKEVKNYVSGGTGADQNRETTYTYADGRLQTLVAKNSTTGDQITRYVYGTTLADSDVASNDLLRAVIFADSTDPDNPLSGSDHVEFRYNRLGEVKEKKDQRQTVHAYEYDALGRQVHDRITVLGPGTDGAIRRITRTYEVRGLTEKITSYTDSTVGQGIVVNELQHVYNNFSQLGTEYQAHSGGVNVASTPRVQYGYASGSNNHVRPISLSYPNGRVLTFDYGTAGGHSDAISRVAALIDAGTHLADYTYVGMDSIVEAASPQPGTKLTYVKQGAEPVGDGGDQYTGWDRFGRVIDQRWIKTSSGTALERVQHGFDRAGNRQWRDNLVAASNQDEYYTYDGLYQLASLDRGNLNGTKTGISGTPTWEEDYTFDPTENWSNYVTRTSGTTTLNQNRTHNKANEITSLAGSSALITQDAAGNIIRTPKATDWTTAYDQIYDAWNRLVKVMDGAATVATYAYDGKNRRTTKTAGGTTRHYYCTQQWQIIEERTGASTTAERQFVWGLRYLDDLLLRDRGTERLYVFHDYFSTTAVVNKSGQIQERYGYDAFGASRVMTPTFGNRTSSSFDWETRYGAYCWDSETSFYYVRNRYLQPRLGRWMSRDLAETLDVNLYSYVGNNPVNHIDALGLYTGPEDSSAITFDPKFLECAKANAVTKAEIQEIAKCAFKCQSKKTQKERTECMKDCLKDALWGKLKDILCCVTFNFPDGFPPGTNPCDVSKDPKHKDSLYWCVQCCEWKACQNALSGLNIIKLKKEYECCHIDCEGTKGTG